MGDPFLWAVCGIPSRHEALSMVYRSSTKPATAKIRLPSLPRPLVKILPTRMHEGAPWGARVHLGWGREPKLVRTTLGTMHAG